MARLKAAMTTSTSGISGRAVGVALGAATAAVAAVCVARALAVPRAEVGAAREPLVAPFMERKMSIAARLAEAIQKQTVSFDAPSSVGEAAASIGCGCTCHAQASATAVRGDTGAAAATITAGPTPSLPLHARDSRGSEEAAVAAAAAVGEPVPSNGKKQVTRNADQFLALHELLVRSYPRMHAALERHVINELSLVYIWWGTDRSLPAAGFAAHLDVVPAVAAEWTVPPFEGRIADGQVWGRGAM